MVASLGWISGQLTINQKLSPSLSWTPDGSGESIAKVFVWEDLANQGALAQHVKLPVSVS